MKKTKIEPSWKILQHPGGWIQVFHEGVEVPVSSLNFSSDGHQQRVTIEVQTSDFWIAGFKEIPYSESK